MFPYFEALLEHLRHGDEIAQRSFGEHVHWGYWDDPRRIPTEAINFQNAGDSMVMQVVRRVSIRPRMRVLDVGCGLGGTIKFLNNRYRDCMLVGLNIDERQLEVARRNVIAKNGHSTPFVGADACMLPFCAESFDVILCVESIFHFGDRANFLRECERVLRPGGELVVSDFVPVLRSGLLINYLERLTHLLGRAYGPVHLDISVSQYRAFASANGLECSAIDDITPHTLPTYEFLKNQIIRNLPRHKATYWFATSLIELAARTGLVRYLVLTFKKPDVAL